MPLPEPKSDEKKSEFMDRCVGDPSMNEEYPDVDQRYAVCHKQWRTKVKSAITGDLRDPLGGGDLR